MVDFSELMAQVDAGGHKKSTVLPEAAIAEMWSVAHRFTTPCDFMVGDLVIARDNSFYVNDGLPCLVVEVDHYAESSKGNTPEGGRLDIRILRYLDGENICAYWCESSYFDRWTSKE